MQCSYSVSYFFDKYSVSYFVVKITQLNYKCSIRLAYGGVGTVASSKLKTLQFIIHTILYVALHKGKLFHFLIFFLIK